MNIFDKNLAENSEMLNKIAKCYISCKLDIIIYLDVTGFCPVSGIIIIIRFVSM